MAPHLHNTIDLIALVSPWRPQEVQRLQEMGLVQSHLLAHRLEVDVRKGRAGPDQVAVQVAKHPELLGPRSLTQHHLVHVAAAAAKVDVLRCLLAAADQAAATTALSGGSQRGNMRLRLANARNARGQTPLMLAAGAAGGLDCVRLLLEAGADPFATDCCGGRTALFYAACSDGADSAALLLEATRGGALPEPAFPNGPATALVDVRMLTGFTALHVAVVADARAVLRVMLRAQPRLVTPTLFGSYDFITCPRGTTPMHLAARHNRMEAAKMILLAFATSTSNGGATALDPRVLLDDLNRLPCQLAAANGHTELSDLLQPGVPLAQVLDGGMDAYLAGPPPLKLLAAVALRNQQQATLKATRRTLGLESPTARPTNSGGSACTKSILAACRASQSQRVHAATACDPAAQRLHKDLGFDIERGATPRATGRRSADFEALVEDEAEAAVAAAAAPQPAAACDSGACSCSAPPAAAKSPRHPADGSEGDESCGVCLDEEPCVQLQPCGHTMCADCCTGLFGMHHTEVVGCPFCRSTVGAFRPTCC